MVIDVIFFAVFIYTFHTGFSRGIIKTVFVGVSVMVGFVAALKFSPFLVPFIGQAINIEGTVLSITAFAMTFFFVMMVIRLLASVMENVVEAANLELVNKFAGGALFSILGVLVYSGILIFANKAHLLTPETLEASAFYPSLERFPSKVANIAQSIFPFITELWDSTVHSMSNAKDALENVDTTRQGY